MGETSVTNRCGNLHVLAESPSTPVDERQPCPECGSLSRSTSVHLTAEVATHSKLTVKAKTPGEKEPFQEGKYGDDFHHDSGTWSHLERTIDRRNDRYRERIVDSEGNVVRDVDEPLSEHRGRGDAKPPPPE